MKNEEILEKTLNKRLFDHLHTGSMKLTDKEILSAMDAARKDEAMKVIESLREYEREYHSLIGFDESDSEEFYQIFKTQSNG